MEPRKIEISHKTIIFTVVFLLSLLILWQVRSLLVLIFICFILMEAVNPTVSRLEKWHIPRPLGILLVYSLIIAALGLAVANIVPILVEQTSGLIETVPAWLSGINLFGASAIDLSSQFRILESLPGNIAKITISFVSNIFSGFVVLVLTFYMLLERKNFSKYSDNLFGNTGRIKALRIIDRLEKTLGSWVTAQLILMTVIGLISYIGYLILGLEYAVPLAIAAGILEVIPNIGPTVTAVLAGIVGFTVSPLTGLLAIGWGVLVQQLENNFIVPRVMKSSVGINPLVTIVVIAAGAKLGGVIGAILAVPIFLTAQTLFQELVLNDKK